LHGQLGAKSFHKEQTYHVTPIPLDFRSQKLLCFLHCFIYNGLICFGSHHPVLEDLLPMSECIHLPFLCQRLCSVSIRHNPWGPAWKAQQCLHQEKTILFGYSLSYHFLVFFVSHTHPAWNGQMSLDIVLGMVTHVLSKEVRLW